MKDTRVIYSTEHDLKLSKVLIHSIEKSILAFNVETGYAISGAQSSVQKLYKQYEQTKFEGEWRVLCIALGKSKFRQTVKNGDKKYINTLPPFKYSFTFLSNNVNTETTLESVCGKCFAKTFDRYRHNLYVKHLLVCDGPFEVPEVSPTDDYQDLVRNGAVRQNVYAQRLFKQSPWFVTMKIPDIGHNGNKLPVQLETTPVTRIYPDNETSWLFKMGATEIANAAHTFPPLESAKSSNYFSLRYHSPKKFKPFSYFQLKRLNTACEFEKGGHVLCAPKTIKRYLKTFDEILAWIKLLPQGCNLHTPPPHVLSKDWALMNWLVKINLSERLGIYKAEMSHPMIACILLRSRYPGTNRINLNSLRFHLAACSWSLFFLNLEYYLCLKYEFSKILGNFRRDLSSSSLKVMSTIRTMQKDVSKDLKHTPGNKTVEHTNTSILVKSLVMESCHTTCINIARFKQQFIASVWHQLDALWLEFHDKQFAYCESLYPIRKYAPRDRQKVVGSLIDYGDEKDWLKQEKERIKVYRKHFYLNHHTGKVNYELCQETLQKIYEWKRIVFVLLYFTTGAPLRGPEWHQLAVCSYHAGSELVARSFYAVRYHGAARLVIQTDENKLRSRGNESFSLRFVGHELAQRLVCYMRLVVPLIDHLADLFAKESESIAANLRTPFFFTYANGDRWDHDTQSEYSAVLKEYTGIGISASRQVLFHIMTTVLGLKEMTITRTDLDRMVEEQKGSSILAQNANNSDRIQEYHYDRDTALIPFEVKSHQDLSLVHNTQLAIWWFRVPAIRFDERLPDPSDGQRLLDPPHPDFVNNLKSSERVKELIEYPSLQFINVACTLKSHLVSLYIAPSLQYHKAMIFGPDKERPVVVVSSEQSRQSYLKYAKDNKINHSAKDLCTNNYPMFTSFERLNQQLVDVIKTTYPFGKPFTLIIDNVDLLPLASERALKVLNAMVALSTSRVTLMADYLTEYTSLWLSTHLPVVASSPRVKEFSERQDLVLSVENNSSIDTKGYKKVLVFWDHEEYGPPRSEDICCFYYDSTQNLDQVKQFQQCSEPAMLFITSEFDFPPLKSVGLIYQVYTKSLTIFRDRLKHLDYYKGFRECVLISAHCCCSYKDWASSDASALTYVISCEANNVCLHRALSRHSFEAQLSYECTHITLQAFCSVCRVKRPSQSSQLPWIY